MALIALVSATGAPGVSTTAIGLAMAWPRPVLLVEAAATGSALLPGFFKGEMLPTKTVLEAAGAQRYGQLLNDLPNHTVQLDTAGRVQCLLGYTDPPTQGRNLAGFWGPLAEAAQDLEGAGMDVIVDAGRAGSADEPTPLLSHAEALIVAIRSSVASVIGARPLVSRFVAERESAVGTDTIGLAVVGPKRPYRTSNIEGALKVPAWLEIAWDPDQASVYSDGVAPTKRFEGSPFARSMVTGAEQITRRIGARRTRMSQRTSR